MAKAVALRTVGSIPELIGNTITHEALSLEIPSGTACDAAAVALQLFTVDSDVAIRSLAGYRAQHDAKGWRFGSRPALRSRSKSMTLLGEHGLMHPVQRVRLDKTDPLSVGLTLAVAEVAPASVHADREPARLLTWAAAENPLDALTIAESEALERWGIGQWWVDTISSANDLQRSYLNPTDVVDLDGRDLRGYRTVSFDRGAPRGWLLGHDETGDERYVLADQVVSTAGYDARAVEVHYPAWSSGASAHPDLRQAWRNAREEIAERSAVLNWWLFGTAAARLPRVLLSRVLPSPLSGFVQDHDGSVVFLTSNAGIHVAVCVLRLADGGVVLGTAGSTSLDLASIKAAKEAVVGFAWLNSAAGIEDPTRVSSPVDHSLLYRSPSFGTRLRAIFDALPEDAAPEKLASEGPLKCIFVRHPVSDVLGTNVIRCISTDRLPMYFGFGNEPLSARQLEDVQSSGPMWHRHPRLDGGLLPHPVG